MILFAVIANALMIASAYIPRSIDWRLYLIIYFGIFILYIVFAVKCKNTSPESAFKLQRLILIISACISVYLAFKPVFEQTRRNDKALYAAAFICSVLLVRWNYYNQD